MNTRSTRRCFFHILASGLLAAVLLPTANAAVTANDVWLYQTFDSSLDVLVPEQGVRTIQFKSAAKDNAPEFVPGIRGQALRVTGENKAALSFTHGLAGFAATRGSLVIWFRPRFDLPETPAKARWLVTGGWASYDLHLENNRFLFYWTTNHQHFLVAELKDSAANWKDNWHCAVATWDGPKQRVYLDAKLVGQRDDVATAPGVPHGFTLGCLTGGQAGDGANFFDGDFDEFAILKAPLPEAQVAELFARGKDGLLATLGGDVRASLPRRGFVRGEKTTLKVTPYAAGDGMEVTLVPAGTDQPVKLASLPCKDTELEIDTARLRPGRYTVRLAVLKDGKAVVSNESLTIGINAARTPELPVGISGVAAYPDAVLAKFQDWHISLEGNGGFYSTDGFFKDLDRLFVYGISMQPCLNIHYHRAWMPYLSDAARYFEDGGTGKGNERARDELLQGLRFEDGAWFSTSIGSPFSRPGRQAMRARIEDVVKASGNHPGLHSLAFDDEYDLRIGTDGKTKKRWYGDYGPEAVTYFQEKTGLKEAIYPPTQPPGTILPDDLPYFKWRDVIGMPGDATCTGLAMNNTEQTDLIHKLRPDILTTAWSGGEYGECDAVMDYTYPTIWQPHPGYECGHARLDFMFDRHRARQRVKTPKPVWGLTGWWSDDLQGKPDWCVQDFRLSTIMTLAKGAKLVLWFTAFSGQPLPKDRLGWGLLSRDDLAQETRRWSEWIHRYGGVFARLDPKPTRRVAVLLSEANRVGQIQQYNNPLMFDRFYPAMRIGGVPVDLITDEKVLDGTLNQYEALCLFQVQYTTRSLWKKINEFAQTAGKVVFCDQSTAAALRPEGAVTLPVHVMQDQPVRAGKNWMETIVATVATNAVVAREQIASKLKPDDLSVSGSNLVAPHWLYGGDGRFLALVNYNLYGPESANISLQNVGGSVYDLLAQKIIAQAKTGEPLAWKAEAIGKAEWKPYVLLARPIQQVDVTAKLDGDKFDVTARVLGDDRKPLRAVIPVHVQFIAPDGKEVAAYETFTATDAHSGAARITFARSKLMDPAGTWQVKTTELVSGKTTTQKVRVP